MEEKRLRELAGLLTEAPTSKALKQVILVTDASPDSELIDVMSTHTMDSLVKIFKSPGIARENPTLYAVRDAKDAKKDAEARIEKSR